MEVDWFHRIVLLFFLIIFSAMFSGSEVALFSLDSKKLDEIKRSSSLIGKYISELLSAPRKLLVTILIGNTIANISASIISVSFAIEIANLYGYPVDIALIVQIIILTIIVILFAEVIPKVWANNHPVYFAKLIAIPLYIVNIILTPISRALSKAIKLATSKVKFDKSKTALSSSEIADLADLGVEKGTLEEDEHGLIHGLVAFKSILVKEVMTPRVDMVSVAADIPLHDLIELIKTSGHSRIPVYTGDLDSIIGVLHSKDLLPFINNDNISFDLPKVVRDCLFVPETKLISVMMKEFQEKNMHLSIVVDEYGGTAGLISLEDILEEIVGEIRDEYDIEEEEIIELSESKFMMSGKVSLSELEEKLKIIFDIPNEDFETLGGFIFNHSGTIPREGYNFEKFGYSFRVTEIENNRINKVEIEKIDIA